MFNYNVKMITTETSSYFRLGYIHPINALRPSVFDQIESIGQNDVLMSFTVLLFDQVRRPKLLGQNIGDLNLNLYTRLHDVRPTGFR